MVNKNTIDMVNIDGYKFVGFCRYMSGIFMKESSEIEKIILDNNCHAKIINSKHFKTKVMVMAFIHSPNSIDENFLPIIKSPRGYVKNL